MNKNYVKEYKEHKVPEGAKYYQEEGAGFMEAFFKTVDGQLMYSLPEDGLMWEVDNSRMSSHAIELPEVPQVWMPVVGEECEVLHDNKWIKCFYIGFDMNHDHVYQFASDFGIRRSYLSIFRSLKAQQEKDREAFIELGMDVITSAKGYSDIAQIPNMLSILFSARFAAPKAGE